MTLAAPQSAVAATDQVPSRRVSAGMTARTAALSQLARTAAFLQLDDGLHATLAAPRRSQHCRQAWIRPFWTTTVPR